MKASDLFVDCLENEGIQYIFGVPGEENEDILFALDKSTSIRFIPTRHEQGAAFIANVYGCLTGQAGVCLSTLGPGATNLMTGVADANLDKSPVAVITAQGSLERLHHESHQKINIVEIFQPITKWNTVVSSPNVISEVIRKAFKVSVAEKPGATHIKLPEDIAKADVAESHRHILPKNQVEEPIASESVILSAVEYLTSATQPLLLIGNGAIRGNATQELRQFVSEFSIPSVSTFMGKGVISDKDDQSLFSVGLGFKDYVSEAFENADLILSIGYDIAEYSPQSWNPDADKQIIHIDFEQAEVYSHYTPDLEIVGNIATTITMIHESLKSDQVSFDTDWYSPIRNRISNHINSYELQDGDDFTIPGVLHLLRQQMADDGIVISDVGSHKMWISRNFQTYVPNGCIVSNGLASMGIALPGGIAASFTYPDRQVVAAMGDGGFMMNMQELETAKRLGVGFTIIIFNDDDFGLISWKQRQSKGDSVGTKIGNPDFVALAKSFGITSYRPENLKELEQKLQESLTSNDMRLIEIPINPEVNDELVKTLDEYWSE